MKIIVDAMGGDHAPHATVHGALQAVKEYGVEVTAEELQEIVVKSSAGELTEDALDMVAGGNWLKKAWGHIKSAFNGLLDGFLSE